MKCDVGIEMETPSFGGPTKMSLDTRTDDTVETRTSHSDKLEKDLKAK